MANRIACIDSNGKLLTMDPYGGNINRLGYESLFYQFPAWSPNGKKLAVLANSREQSSVYVMADHPDSILTSLFEGITDAAFYLYWRPDGQAVTFITTHPVSKMALRMSSVDGKETEELLQGIPCFWQWSQDSNGFLYHVGGNDDNAELAYHALHDEENDIMLDEPGIFQSPGISATGDFWAYSTLDMANKSQLVIDGNSIASRQTISHKGVLAMTWSPVLDELAFVSPQDNVRYWYGPLQILNALSGEQRVLTEEQVVAFFWSPNGRYITYITVKPSQDIVGQLQEKTIYTNGSAPPRQQATRDEKRIPFLLSVVEVATGIKRELAEFHPVPVLINRFLPFFDQYAHSHQLWSPDSTEFVFPILETEDTSKIMVYPIDGSPAREIADGLMAFWSPV